jgi:hypothetical protein
MLSNLRHKIVVWVMVVQLVQQLELRSAKVNKLEPEVAELIPRKQKGSHAPKMKSAQVSIAVRERVIADVGRNS